MFPHAACMFIMQLLHMLHCVINKIITTKYVRTKYIYLAKNILANREENRAKNNQIT